MLSFDHLLDDRGPRYLAHRKEGFVMTKKSRLEIAREIVARVKSEMERPRVTASVRDGEAGLTVPAVKPPGVP
jgi:hypothetical protein